MLGRVLCACAAAVLLACSPPPAAGPVHGEEANPGQAERAALRDVSERELLAELVPPPIPTDEIVRSSANMHLIPASDAVRTALARVRTGQIVRFEGELIEATEPSGWRWRSSLTREDSGAGACEVVWVESLDTE